MDYYFFSTDSDIRGPIPRKGKTAGQSYLLSSDADEAVRLWKERNGNSEEVIRGFIYRCIQTPAEKMGKEGSINNAYRSEAPLMIVEKTAVEG